MFDPITLIGLVATWVGGWLWKRNPALLNKAIPIVTFAISLVTQIIAAIVNAKPADAAVAGATLVVGSIFSSELFKVVAKAVLQWLIATGAHSAQKNVREGIAAKKAAEA